MPGQENSSAQPGGGADGGSMMSTQERQRFFCLHFYFDYKTVAHKFSGMASSHLLTCKPHKYPVLVSYFLSIALPLAEFFLC